MMVLRRVDELKAIDGRLDVVPPEAAARLRTGNCGGGPDDGTMRDAKYDDNGGGKGTVMLRCAIRQNGGISAAPPPPSIAPGSQLTAPQGPDTNWR